MKAPIRIAVTGAAGQISYSLLFRIANGDMLTREQPIILQLLDIPQAQQTLRGVAMELEDCVFPMLQQVIVTDDPKVAFRDAEIVLLIGARPRSKGMERNDLIEINAGTFAEQGKILNAFAAPDVKILVVGNPANTNALIVIRNAPDLNPKNVSSMMRLDHNRAIAQVARKLSQPIGNIKKWWSGATIPTHNFQICHMPKYEDVKSSTFCRIIIGLKANLFPPCRNAERW